MRFLVLGAGAVGGYFGGRLVEAERDVTFLVRGPRTAALAEHGLTVESPLGDFRVPVKVATADMVDGPYDVVLLTAKHYDLDTAIEAIRPGMGPDSAVLPLLNGLVHLDRLAAAFGPDRVLGGVAYVGASLQPDGSIRHHNRLSGIAFGERGGGISERARAIEAEFTSTLVSAPASENILLEMWEKFTMMGAMAGMNCLLRGTIGEIAVDDLIMQLGPMGTATIAHVKMSGFDVRPALERILAGAALALKLLDGVKLGHIEYDGIRFQPPTGDAFILGTFSLDNLAFDHGVPISADLAYGGLHLSRAQLAAGHPAFDELKELGIDGMTLSLRIAYLWKPDQNRVAIHDTNFKIDELGALGLSADIDLAGLAAGATWASTAKITHAALRYDDASLVDRALRFSASRQNIAPGAMREQMVGMLTQQGTAPGASPALANAAKALADFVAAPHSLIVELTPPAPIALAVLQVGTAVGTPQLVRMLGLTVTAAP